MASEQAVKTPRHKPNRAEKARRARQALLDAAAEVVGEYGYTGASIARITERANLAHGTFYNYFEDRQDILDQLLPTIDSRLLAAVETDIAQARTAIEAEDAGFRAFLNFALENPAFSRIVDEAGAGAPRARKAHFQRLSERFHGILHAGWKRGELPGYDEDELQTLAYILMASSNWLAMLHSRPGMTNLRDPADIAATYLKFLKGGMNHRPDEEPDKP